MVQTDPLQECVREMDEREAFESEICYRCVGVGIPPPYYIFNRYQMIESPGTGHLICMHCHDTEVEFGLERLTDIDRERAWSTIAQFKKYKRKRT